MLIEIKINTKLGEPKTTKTQQMTFISVNATKMPVKMKGRIFLAPTNQAKKFTREISRALKAANIETPEELLKASQVATSYKFCIKYRYGLRDLSNLVKHTEDLLHKEVKIDDRKVVLINAGKVEAKNNTEERLLWRISKIE